MPRCKPIHTPCIPHLLVLGPSPAWRGVLLPPGGIRWGCLAGARLHSAAAGMLLLDLDDSLLRHVCSFLPGAAVARLQACSRRLRRATGKSSLWRALCLRDHAWWAADAIQYREPRINWQQGYGKLVRSHDCGLDALPKKRYHIDQRGHRGEAPEGRRPEACMPQVAQAHASSGGRPRLLCERCWRPLNACLCSHLPAVPFNNCHCRVIVVQHPRCHVADGTLRLLVLGLHHCEVLVGADVTSPRAAAAPQFARLNALLDDARATKYLLYPAPDATDVAALPPLCPATSDAVTADVAVMAAVVAGVRDVTVTMMEAEQGSASGSSLCDCGHPRGHDYVTLIAIDGSWRHAKHIGGTPSSPTLMSFVPSPSSIPSAHPNHAEAPHCAPVMLIFLSCLAAQCV